MKDLVHGASFNVGIKEFMESSGRAKFRKALDDLPKDWLDENGALRPEAVVEQPCPVCRSEEGHVAFVKDAFPHKICANCSMMYVSPMLRPNVSAGVFFRDSRESDNWVDVLLNENQREYDRPKFEQGLDLCKEHAAPGAHRVLDIGCGVGHFLELARARGWECAGVELNRRAVDHCLSLGLNVTEQVLEEGVFPDGSFDVVTLWDVLEHVPYPGELADIIHKLLSPGGLFVVRVPNGQALAARILQEKCNMFAGHTHINLFSPATLERFVAGHGFAKLYRNTSNPEFNVLNNYLDYTDPYSGESSEREVLLGGLLGCEEVFARDLGYAILMVARKDA